MGDFVFEGPVGYLDNLSPNSGSEEELGRATEGETEERSRWGRLQPQTEVILVQTFF